MENVIPPTGVKESTTDEYGICENHVFHQYTLRLKNTDRDALVAYLNSKEIPCGVYYPIPLHKQKAYSDSRYNESVLPVNNALGIVMIFLHMHTIITNERQSYIDRPIL